MKMVFTIEEAAEICGVASQEAIRWFNSGALKGYRVEDSPRIPREYLINYIEKQHGMPLGELDEAIRRVLIVADDEDLIDNLKQEMPPEKLFLVEDVHNSFDAGIQAERFSPDCLIVDFSIDKAQALVICQRLKHDESLKETPIIAVFPRDSDSALLSDTSSFAVVLKEPFNVRLLVKEVQRLITAKKAPA